MENKADSDFKHQVSNSDLAEIGIPTTFMPVFILGWSGLIEIRLSQDMLPPR